MKKIWLVFVLFCLACVLAPAQTTRVRGTVTDAETGEPIPFVGVYFDGTTIGISTDLEGHYSLETRSPDAHILTAQLIGYHSQSFVVVNGSFSEVNFRLQQDVNRLSAAVVRPNNRYIRSILREIDRHRAANNPDLAPSWEAGLYSKMELDMTDYEPILDLGIVDRSLGFVREYTDTSAITGKPFIPFMISENVSRKFHSTEPEFDRELMLSSRVSGLDQDNILRQFTGTYLLRTNLYDASISVFNLTIPNPVASSSHMFYNYFLVDSLQVEGRKTYVLRFHPKSLVTSPVLDGEMQIDAEDFGIRTVHAALSSASNVNWIRHINIDVENRRLPDGTWFWGEERLFIDFSISVSDDSRVLSFLGRRQLVWDEPEFGPVTNQVVLEAEDPVVMRLSQPGDSLYWAQARPYPLSQRETGVFDMVESVKEKPAFKFLYGTANMFITGYAEFPSIGFGYGPWARTISFNDTEGLRLQVGFRTTKEFNPKLRLRGSLAYGFKDQKFKWRAGIEYVINREKTRKISFNVKQDYDQMGRGAGIFNEQNIFSSIFARSHADKQSLVREGIISYDHEFAQGVNTTLRMRHFRLWGNDAIPLQRQDLSFQESFSLNEIHATLRLSWDERINRGFFEKSYIFTRYPVLNFDVIGGFNLNGLAEDSFNYLRGELSVDWNVPAGALGFGKLHINGGGILGQVPYPLLKLHEGNQTYFLDRTAFACMDYYEFASDRWLTAFYEHNFNGLLLGKIPGLKKFDLREVATIRGAWGTISAHNLADAPFILPVVTNKLEVPYVEAGIGISNIFRLFRIDAYWRLTHRGTGSNRDFTINVGLDMEF